MSRRFPHVLALIVCSLCATNVVSAQKIEPLPHPNHYIVLVDASGSTVQSEPKRRLYESLLTENLVFDVYNRGFGSSIPPYEPKQDRLTLFHFGIVTGDTATAYSRLADYDFSNDFIHEQFIREPGIDAARFRQSVFPRQMYQYTILAWAKQMALERLRQTNTSEVSQRTFLIIVHDGLANENSVAGEVEMVRRWSGANYERTNPIISAIDRNYLFGDESGAKGAASEEQISDQQNNIPLFFVEAFEVISAADNEWQAQARQLSALKDSHLRWVDDSAETPRGVLTVQLTKEFEDWLKTADNSRPSLATADGKQSNVGLELPLVFPQRLTCTPLKLNTEFSVALQRADPLLGRRELKYSKPYVISAPMPWRCSAAFLVERVVVLLALICAIGALVYYIYFRFNATHLEIELPATVGTIKIKRKGGARAVVSARPQLNLQALALKIPHPIWQLIFYRNATIGITSRSNEQLVWSNKSNGILRMPLPVDYSWLAWRQVPKEPTQITLVFNQGRHNFAVDIAYPAGLDSSLSRSVNMDRDSAQDEQKVYVSLDLGSESMAAYYEEFSGSSGMIDLQNRAADLLGIGGGISPNQEVGYLKEMSPDGRLINSPRLWNRISLRDDAQPENPDETHAQLIFSDKATYEESLFTYFHRVGGWPPDAKILPNPKILFQHQIKTILPFVKATGTGAVNLNPEMLIQHLTVQIVRNFVIGSARLKGIDPTRIYLTITVPNVYSLPHALSLKDFVFHNAGVKSVDIISESDAVACSVLSGPDDADPQDLREFKERMEKSLTQRKRISLLTIDIGKGTTDLSCTQVEEPKRQRTVSKIFAWLLRREPEEDTAAKQSELKYWVLGKTGKSTGGNYLNFLIAQHYQQRLQRVAPQIHSSTNLEVPFGFLARSANPIYDMPQLRAISDLEQLIEAVKRAITDQGELDNTVLSDEKQRELLNPLIDKMLQQVNPMWSPALETANEKSFRDQLVEALLLPRRLGESGWRGTLRWLKPFWGGLRAQEEDLLQPIIGRYVKENVDDLLDNLKSLVEEHRIGTKQGDPIDRNVFVVIAGQASQFAPLRRAILEKCGRLHISPLHVHPMGGVRAKEACCKGVINFKNLNMVIANATELHGTYGCLAVGMRPKDQQFKPFDMRKIRNGGTSKVKFNAKVDHYLVFTPRAYRDVVKSPPRKNDGATALIARFERVDEFSMQYNPDDLELKVNDLKLELKGFGDLDGSIYPKVWPEIIAPVVT